MIHWSFKNELNPLPPPRVSEQQLPLPMMLSNQPSHAAQVLMRTLVVYHHEMYRHNFSWSLIFNSFGLFFLNFFASAFVGLVIALLTALIFKYLGCGPFWESFACGHSGNHLPVIIFFFRSSPPTRNGTSFKKKQCREGVFLFGSSLLNIFSPAIPPDNRKLGGALDRPVLTRCLAAANSKETLNSTKLRCIHMGDYAQDCNFLH